MTQNSSWQKNNDDQLKYDKIFIINDKLASLCPFHFHTNSLFSVKANGVSRRGWPLTSPLRTPFLCVICVQRSAGQWLSDSSLSLSLVTSHVSRATPPLCLRQKTCNTEDDDNKKRLAAWLTFFKIELVNCGLDYPCATFFFKKKMAHAKMKGNSNRQHTRGKPGKRASR